MLGLLRRSLDARGAAETWDAVIRPALAWFGERWESDQGCIAAEHVLTDCTATVLRSAATSRAGSGGRPVLLVGGPGETHILPLCALAAALAERSVPSCLLGTGTPVASTAEAVRRVKPFAVVVWSQSNRTADPDVFSDQPHIRSGHAVLAAGPGWAGRRLPRRVDVPTDLAEALALLDVRSSTGPGTAAGAARTPR